MVRGKFELCAALDTSSCFVQAPGSKLVHCVARHCRINQCICCEAASWWCFPSGIAVNDRPFLVFWFLNWTWAKILDVKKKVTPFKDMNYPNLFLREYIHGLPWCCKYWQKRIFNVLYSPNSSLAIFPLKLFSVFLPGVRDFPTNPREDLRVTRPTAAQDWKYDIMPLPRWLELRTSHLTSQVEVPKGGALCHQAATSLSSYFQFTSTKFTSVYIFMLAYLLKKCHLWFSFLCSMLISEEIVPSLGRQVLGKDVITEIKYCIYPY